MNNIKPILIEKGIDCTSIEEDSQIFQKLYTASDSYCTLAPRFKDQISRPTTAEKEQQQQEKPRMYF